MILPEFDDEVHGFPAKVFGTMIDASVFMDYLYELDVSYRSCVCRHRDKSVGYAVMFVAPTDEAPAEYTGCN